MSTVLKTVGSLAKPFVTSNKRYKVKIDEWIFKLHYRVTFSLILLFSALVCMREYVGEHIKCLPIFEEDQKDRPVIPQNVLQTYCFITTTFTVPYSSKSHLDRTSYADSNRLGGPPYVFGKSEKVHHAYYQWVPFFLFLLAIISYVPHAIWKSIENKKITHLTQNLHTKDLEVEEGVKSQKVALLASYIVNSRGHHVRWAIGYVLCESANLIAVLMNIYLIDIFLGNEFMTYGPKVLQFLEDDPEDRVDPMAVVFPKVTKCLFNVYGPSGGIQRFDALCILASNIINEKIFTFLWFWLVIVAILSGSFLIYRLSTLFSFRLRLLGLDIDKPYSNSQAAAILEGLGISEWLLLRLLRLNLDSSIFERLIVRIYDELI